MLTPKQDRTKDAKRFRIAKHLPDNTKELNSMSVEDLRSVSQKTSLDLVDENGRLLKKDQLYDGIFDAMNLSPRKYGHSPSSLTSDIRPRAEQDFEYDEATTAAFTAAAAAIAGARQIPAAVQQADNEVLDGSNWEQRREQTIKISKMPKQLITHLCETTFNCLVRNELPTTAFAFANYFSEWINFKEKNPGPGLSGDAVLRLYFHSEFFRRETLASNLFGMNALGLAGPGKLKEQFRLGIGRMTTYLDPSMPSTAKKLMEEHYTSFATEFASSVTNSSDFLSKYFNNRLLEGFVHSNMDYKVAKVLLFGISDDKSMFLGKASNRTVDWKENMPSCLWNPLKGKDDQNLSKILKEISSSGIKFEEFASVVQQSANSPEVPHDEHNLVELDKLLEYAFSEECDVDVENSGTPLFTGPCWKKGPHSAPSTPKELITFLVQGTIYLGKSQDDWKWALLQIDSFSSRLKDLERKAAGGVSLADFFGIALRRNLSLPIYFLSCVLNFIYHPPKNSSKLAKSLKSVSFFASRIKAPFIRAFKELEKSPFYKTCFIKFGSIPELAEEVPASLTSNIAREFVPRAICMDPFAEEEDEDDL